MVLGTVKISKNNAEYNNCVNVYFDKNAGSLLYGTVVFDKIKLRFRNSTIDDKKTYKPNYQKNCRSCVIGGRFPNQDEILGLYEVELSECGEWYQMYKL